MLWLCKSPSGLMYDNTPGWLQLAVWLTVSLGKYTSIFNHEIDIENLHFDEESFSLFVFYEKDGTFRSYNLSLTGTQSSFFTVKHEHDLFKNKHDSKILRDSSMVVPGRPQSAEAFIRFRLPLSHIVWQRLVSGIRLPYSSHFICTVGQMALISLTAPRPARTLMQ